MIQLPQAQVDWSSLGVNPAETMVLFDDHQDQMMRLEQAQALGFIHIVFDDNYLPGTGGVPNLHSTCASTSDFMLRATFRRVVACMLLRRRLLHQRRLRWWELWSFGCHRRRGWRPTARVFYELYPARWLAASMYEFQEAMRAA